MAQTAYTGLQGHGKSYEVVASVIVPQFAKGRRIVTNIAGLQVDLIADYCVNHLGADRSKLGTIVAVTNEDVAKPKFFPKEKQDNSDKVVQPGDLVILDEVWRWYVTGEKIPDGHLEFFRMHRHFVSPETGKTCDIVLIVQVIDDLQRKIRGTVEKSFLMQKHVDFGKLDSYVVSVYSGNRQSRLSFLESFQKKYDPEIFPLYKSHSQASAETPAANEERADQRGNVLNRPLIKYGLPVAVCMILASFFFVWRFFHPDQKKPVTTPATASASAASPASVVTSSASRSDGVSDRWRLIGFVRVGGLVTYALSDSAGRVRYLSDVRGVKVTPLEVELALPNGDVVTRWSGSDRPGKVLP